MKYRRQILAQIDKASAALTVELDVLARPLHGVPSEKQTIRRCETLLKRLQKSLDSLKETH